MFLKVGSAILTAALSLHHKEGLEFLVSPLLQPLLISEESKLLLYYMYIYLRFFLMALLILSQEVNNYHTNPSSPFHTYR